MLKKDYLRVIREDGTTSEMFVVDVAAQLLDNDGSHEPGEAPHSTMSQPEVNIDGDGNAVSSDSSETDDELSDDEDIFQIKPLAIEHCPPGYNQCFLYRWKAAVTELSTKLRHNVLLPLVPGSTEAVYTDVHSGVALPSWHCAFADCDARSSVYEESKGCKYSYEHYLWQHLNLRHGHTLTGLAKKYK